MEDVADGVAEMSRMEEEFVMEAARVRITMEDVSELGFC